MALRLRRPDHRVLLGLLAEAGRSSLTYGPTGSSLDPSVATPDGLGRREWSTELRAPDAFAAGIRALQGWRVHRGAGLSVEADGPLRVGTDVAMSAPLPLGFVDATCRVVAVVDGPDRFGFAYGTLPVHPERGEESFVLTRTEDGARFTVCAVSRPVHPLARLAPPVADALQRAAVGRYLRAMADAVA